VAVKELPVKIITLMRFNNKIDNGMQEMHAAPPQPRIHTMRDQKCRDSYSTAGRINIVKKYVGIFFRQAS